MPTYEYACKDCDHQFEIFQGFDEDTLTVCPTCQGRLRKKFTSVGVVFKGSGFYRTDSRSGSTASEPAKKKEPAAASTSSSTTTSSSSSGTATAASA